MLGRTLTVVLTAAFLWGCGAADYDKRRNESHAMSYVKKFQTAVTLHHVEYGSHTNMAALFETGEIEAPVYEAWDQHDAPKAHAGYLYTYFQGGDERIGLCAYPAKPGTSGDVMICALGDLSAWDDEWELYTTNFEHYGRPLHDWPTRRELESDFVRMERRRT